MRLSAKGVFAATDVFCAASENILLLLASWLLLVSLLMLAFLFLYYSRLMWGPMLVLASMFVGQLVAADYHDVLASITVVATTVPRTAAGTPPFACVISVASVLFCHS